MDCSHQFVIVTGATSGIGAAYAKEFAAQRARLLLTGRRTDLLEARRVEAVALGAESVELLVGDLSNPSVADRLVRRASSEPVAVLVNNVGFGLYSTVAEADIEALRSMLSVQADLPLRLIHAVLPTMVGRGSGFVVNVGSLAGRVAVPGAAAYVSTKIFLERLSETLAIEVASAGVVVQALTPGYVRTDFHRDVADIREKQKNRGLVRWMDAEDVVGCSLRALERAENTLRRHPRRVRRRNTVVIPGLANRFLAAIAPFVPRTLVYRAAASQKPV